MRTPRWLRRIAGSTERADVYVAGPGAEVPEFGGPVRLVVILSAPAPPRTVPEQRLRDIVEAVENEVLEALDTFYGSATWRLEITVRGLAAGPEVVADILVDPREVDEDQNSFLSRVESEFRRVWASTTASA